MLSKEHLTEEGLALSGVNQLAPWREQNSELSTENSMRLRVSMELRAWGHEPARAAPHRDGKKRTSIYKLTHIPPINTIAVYLGSYYTSAAYGKAHTSNFNRSFSSPFHTLPCRIPRAAALCMYTVSRPNLGRMR